MRSRAIVWSGHRSFLVGIRYVGDVNLACSRANGSAAEHSSTQSLTIRGQYHRIFSSAYRRRPPGYPRLACASSTNCLRLHLGGTSRSQSPTVYHRRAPSQNRCSPAATKRRAAAGEVPGGRSPVARYSSRLSSAVKSQLPSRRASAIQSMQFSGPTGLLPLTSAHSPHNHRPQPQH